MYEIAYAYKDSVSVRGLSKFVHIHLLAYRKISWKLEIQMLMVNALKWTAGKRFCKKSCPVVAVYKHILTAVCYQKGTKYTQVLRTLC